MTNFSKLEKQKAETLALVQDWSTDQINFRPQPRAWSAGEVIDHLVKVEKGILGAVQQGLRTPHRIGIKDRVGVFFVDRIFRTRFRVKVPGSVSTVLPDDNAELGEIVRRWEETRVELASLLERTQPEQFRLGVFRHPVAGWMSLDQVLDFFSVHLIHHRFQLDRLAASRIR